MQFFASALFASDLKLICHGAVMDTEVTFSSDHLSSNPAEVHRFYSVNQFKDEKNTNNSSDS